MHSLAGSWFERKKIALNDEFESFSSVLVIGQQGFCGILNSREFNLKMKISVKMPRQYQGVSHCFLWAPF